METMNIQLPETLKSFVDEQVAAGRFRDASDYVHQLILRDQLRRSEEEVDAKLLEGLRSGPPIEFTAEDWGAKKTSALAKVLPTWIGLRMRFTLLPAAILGP